MNVSDELDAVVLVGRPRRFMADLSNGHPDARRVPGLFATYQHPELTTSLESIVIDFTDSALETAGRREPYRDRFLVCHAEMIA